MNADIVMAAFAVFTFGFLVGSCIKGAIDNAIQLRQAQQDWKRRDPCLAP